MKLVWTLTITIFISIFGLTLQLKTALAEEEMSEVEGVVEIDLPGAAEAKVEVNITGKLFSVAAKAVRSEEEPDLSDFLAGLKALHVRVYETKSLVEQPGIVEFCKDMVKYYEQKLLKANWEVVARIKENGNMTGIYTLTQNDVVRGLFAVVSNEQEIVIVNLAGKIDLSKLSELNSIAGMDLKLPNLGTKGKKKVSPEAEAQIKEYRDKALEYMADGKLDEAIAQLEEIPKVDAYLISDYATLASIYLMKGDISKCYYFLSRAYELEKNKEIADTLRSKAASVGEKR
jgi:tetratricopeptide (TPR) repeat protein